MILIDEICKKNHIFGNIVVKNTKFNSGRLFFSNDYIIKLYPGIKEKYFANEYYIYKNLHGKTFLPQLVDYSTTGEKYIVITRLKARPIFEVWNELTETERENAIKQISDILKQINSLPTIDNNISFKEYLKSQFEENVKGNHLNDELGKQVNSLFYNTINKISDDETKRLVYADFHFNNFLIDQKNKVYIVDFENLVTAPLDYQLNSIIRMCLDPRIEAHNDIMIDEKDYITIPKYFKKYYREMFLNPNWKDRVKIYILINHLRTLKHNKITSKVIEDDIER